MINRSGRYHVLSDDVVASADEVSRKFDELTARISTFGKRVAVAMAEGIAEAADLRAKLDEIFKNETQGRAVLGDDLYNVYVTLHRPSDGIYRTAEMLIDEMIEKKRVGAAA